MEVFANAAIEPWMNLSALTALIVVVLWGVTKGIPNMQAKFTEALTAQQEAFTAALEKQHDDYREEMQGAREDYREELRLHRDHSRSIAESGHQSVDKLTGSVQALIQSKTQG